jgi:hypothetical protein
MAFEEPPASLQERQRTAFAIMIEGLGSDHAIDVYNAGGLADLVAAHGNHALEQRHAAGQDTMVREKVFEGCRWPDDHHVATGRSAIFDPVEAKLSAAGGVVDEPRQVGVGGNRKRGDEGDRHDGEHRHLATKPCRITDIGGRLALASLRPGHEVGEAIAHMAAVLTVERSVAMDPHFLERVFGESEPRRRFPGREKRFLK